MALIKCKECGHEISDKASACPNCGCPMECVYKQAISNINTNHKQNKKKGIIGIVLACLLTFTICCFITKGNDKNSILSSDAQKGIMASSENSPNDRYSEIKEKGNWGYQTQKDPMTDKITYLANCVSEEEQTIYDERTKLFLGIIHHKGENFVVLSVLQGILRQDRLPMAHVRFDDGEVEMWAVIADGKTTHHIIKADDFISRLKSSEKCAIKVEAEDGRTGTYTFKTKGLEWNH